MKYVPNFFFYYRLSSIILNICLSVRLSEILLEKQRFSQLLFKREGWNFMSTFSSRWSIFKYPTSTVVRLLWSSFLAFLYLFVSVSLNWRYGNCHVWRLNPSIFGLFGGVSFTLYLSFFLFICIFMTSHLTLFVSPFELSVIILFGNQMN